MVRLPVSTFRYESIRETRTALRLRIREIAQTRVRYGYRKIRVLLNREGLEGVKEAGISPSMRRPVGVKWILFLFRRALFFSRRIAAVAMLPSALSKEHTIYA